MINITKLNQQKMDLLGTQLKAEFQANELLRKDKENEFLESLRQIEQQYDPEALALMTAEEPKIYPGYTRSKTIPLKAKLVQHLLPEKDLNWNIKPTAIPSVSQKTLDYIVNTLATALNITPDQLTVEQVEMGIKEVTAERCEKMKVVMTDQLLEDKYTDIQREALYSGIDYGTGVIKGALSKPYSSTKIIKTIDPLTGVTKWEQKTKNHYRPSGECVRIWNCFPDMTAVSIDKCRFWDTLRCETKHDVRGLAERTDFFGEVITEFLNKNPKGNYKLRDWEITTLTTGTHNTNTPKFLSDKGYGSSSPQSVQETNNYEIIERDCYLDGWQLYEMGITEVEDINEEYFCNIWLLGEKIIKIALWDKDLYTTLEELYHIFYYDKNETSIFAKGLPKVIRYPQLGMAACDRHILKNAAWIAGPCGEVNASLLHPSQVKDANKLSPGKFFVKEARGQDANAHVLNFYSVDARTNELLAIKNDLKNQGDSDSSLPSYLFGDNSTKAGDTPLGTSKMIFASMIDFIKNLVGSFDKMHKSYLDSVYKWNMVFNPDENIKGDMQVDTIGSAAAIINEAIVSQWAFLIQSMPDEPKDRIDWNEWLKMYGKYSGLPEYEKIVLSEEKYKEKVQQRQQEQERQMAIQEGLAQAKVGKDIQSAKKTEAATAKIIAELPYNVAAKEVDNESKQVDNFGKVIDMQHKKVQMDTAQTDNILKVAEAIKEENEPTQ